MKKILLAVLLSIIVLFSAMLIKMATFTSKQIEVDPVTHIKFDKHQAAVKLSR